MTSRWDARLVSHVAEGDSDVPRIQNRRLCRPDHLPFWSCGRGGPSTCRLPPYGQDQRRRATPPPPPAPLPRSRSTAYTTPLMAWLEAEARFNSRSLNPWVLDLSPGASWSASRVGSGYVGEVPTQTQKEKGDHQRHEAGGRDGHQAGEDHDNRTQDDYLTPPPPVGHPPGDDGEGEHPQGMGGDHQRDRAQGVLVGLHVDRGDRHRHHHHHLGKNHADHGHDNPRLPHDLREGAGPLPGDRFRVQAGEFPPDIARDPAAAPRRSASPPGSVRQSRRRRARSAPEPRPTGPACRWDPPGEARTPPPPCSPARHGKWPVPAPTAGGPPRRQNDPGPRPTWRSPPGRGLPGRGTGNGPPPHPSRSPIRSPR